MRKTLFWAALVMLVLLAAIAVFLSLQSKGRRAGSGGKKDTQRLTRRAAQLEQERGIKPVAAAAQGKTAGGESSTSSSDTVRFIALEVVPQKSGRQISYRYKPSGDGWKYIVAFKAGGFWRAKSLGDPSELPDGFAWSASDLQGPSCEVEIVFACFEGEPGDAKDVAHAAGSSGNIYTCFTSSE